MSIRDFLDHHSFQGFDSGVRSHKHGDLRFSGDIHFSDLSLLLTSDIPSLCVSCDGLRELCASVVLGYIRVSHGNLKCIKNVLKEVR